MESLSIFLSEYLLERDVSKAHANLLKATLLSFSAWLGHSATPADLTDGAVNRWLAHLTAIGKQRWTVKGYRSRLLAIWNAAYWRDPPLVDHAPGRVRKIEKPKTVPQAWDLEQLKSLLLAAAKVEGHFLGTGVNRRLFWLAYLPTAFDTGLRLGDLLAMPLDGIGSDGTIAIVQHKTGWPILCRVWPETIEAISNLRRQHPISRFGQAFTRRYFFGHFQSLVTAAGLRGTSRKLRISSGSWVEKMAPGMGHLHLGHTGNDVFRAHYQDPRISAPHRPLPPRIA